MCSFLELMSDTLDCQATMDTVLQEQSGWDSMGILAVISVIDEGFGIVLDTRIQDCITVRDIYELLEAHRQEKEA